MNKARRQELKMLKYKRRLNLYGLKEGEGNFFAYRNHSCPCSCFVCSGQKFDRAEFKRETLKVMREAA